MDGTVAGNLIVEIARQMQMPAGGGSDVVYVPTPMETVNRMLDIAEVVPKDYVVDLGSGDGRIAIAAGRRGARALGVDLDSDRLREAEANLKRAGVGDRVSFRRKTCSRPVVGKTDLNPSAIFRW
jgi:methylase of polypeptide subunit release factors